MNPSNLRCKKRDLDHEFMWMQTPVKQINSMFVIALVVFCVPDTWSISHVTSSLAACDERFPNLQGMTGDDS